MAKFFWNGSLIATLAYFSSVYCPTFDASPAPRWNRKTHPAARNLRFQRGAGIASKVGQYAEEKWANVAIRAPFQKNLAIPIKVRMGSFSISVAKNRGRFFRKL